MASDGAGARDIDRDVSHGADRPGPEHGAGGVGPEHGDGRIEVRLAPVSRRTRWSARAGRFRVVGISVLVATVAAVAAVAAVAVARTGRPGGDPGGTVLQALRPVARDVPPGSVVVSVGRHDATWSAACPDNPGGRAGWSGVEVVAVFATTRTGPSVVDTVGSALAAQGWRPAARVDDAAWQYEPVAEWAKAVPGTTSARVVVFPYPSGAGPAPTAGASTWLLGAEGKTPGYALPGC